MKRVWLAALGFLALAPSAGIQAQSRRAAVELIAGVTMPQGDLSYETKQEAAVVTGVTNNVGWTMGGNVLYGLNDRFYLVAGFSRTQFGCSGNGGCPAQAGAGSNRNAPGTDPGSLVIQGPQVGADWRVADTEGMGFRLRGLIDFDQPKFTGAAGTSFDRAIGFELGFGVDLHLNDRFVLAPELRWNSSRSNVTTGVAGGGATATVHPSYTTADVAFRATL